MTNPDEIWGAQLHIGTSGSSGHLEILDGGFVSSKTAFVSNGSATIQGPGSIWRTEKHWQNSGSLSSGDIENFQLSVLDGGQLQVGTDLWLGAIETHRTTEVLISGEGSTIRAGMLYLGTNTTATIEKGGLLRVDRFDSYNQHQGVLVVGEGGQVVITEFVGGANAPAIRVANHAAILLESSSFYWNNLFFNSRPLEQSGNYVNGRITVKDVHGVFHVIGDATRRNNLQGSGEVVGRVSLGSGGWLAAGNSTGTFTATHATFNGGAGFQFEINSAVGIAGTDVGWDLLNLTGVLDIAATGDNPFFLDINSMGLQLADFDSNQNYAWNFVYAAGGINGFSADAFELDFSNFQNDLAGGSFSVVQNGNYLTLNFTAVPEPSAMTLVLLLVSIGMARRRRSARPLTAVNPEGAPSGLLEQRP
jgi:hypothetical protein